MPIHTQLTELLGVKHTILLAAMDLEADARLTAAVSEVGGFGTLGTGHGDRGWDAAGHPDAKAHIVSASADKTVRSTIFDVSRQNIRPEPYTGRCLLR